MAATPAITPNVTAARPADDGHPTRRHAVLLLQRRQPFVEVFSGDVHRGRAAFTTPAPSHLSQVFRRSLRLGSPGRCPTGIALGAAGEPVEPAHLAPEGFLKAGEGRRDLVPERLRVGPAAVRVHDLVLPR